MSSSQGDAKEVVHHHAASSTAHETKNEAMQLSSAEVSSSSKDVLQQQQQHNQQQQQQQHGHINVKGMTDSNMDMDKSMPPPGNNWGIQGVASLIGDMFDRYRLLLSC